VPFDRSPALDRTPDQIRTPDRFRTHERSAIGRAGRMLRNGASSRATMVVGGTAAALAGATLYNTYRAYQAEAENPPLGEFIEVDGVRLHYLEAGQGSPVVLLHGNGTMIDDFVISGLFDRVARSHRVIAFDRPGYGYSERPRDRIWSADAQAALFAQAFARLGIERPVVLGHSWGTLVAMSLAIQEPSAVRGLVVASGYFFPTARADVPLFAPPAIPIIGDLLRYTASPLIGRLILDKLIRKMFAPRPVPPRFEAEFPKELLLRPWQIRASSEETAFMVPGVAANQSSYSEIDLPVEIIVGANDRIVDYERQSVFLTRALPSSRLHVVPGLGHMVHYGAPDRVAEAIERIATG
jgi:pimeloyl-ACP methyl ester carboxylesterase